MGDLRINSKRWLEAIREGQIKSVVDELEQTADVAVTPEENKILFKLLLQVTHVASKCDFSDRKSGSEICRITSWLCSRMTDVPSAEKFFSCVYWITGSLLEMSLFLEAAEICDFLLPGRLWNDDKKISENMFSQISSLFNKSTTKKLTGSKIFSRDDWKTTTTMIKYELDLMQFAYPHPWRWILSKILSYCKIVESTTTKCSESFKREFTDDVLDYIGRSNVSLDNQNKEKIYRTILLLITEMAVRDLKKLTNGTSVQTFVRYFDVFRSCLKIDPHYARCYEIYERLSIALVKPLEKFRSEEIETIKFCTVEFTKIRKIEEYRNAVKWYSYAVSQLLNPLITYWEESTKTGATKYFTTELFTSVFDYLDVQCRTYRRFELENCCCNRPKVCRSSHDVHSDVGFRLKAILVVGLVLAQNKEILSDELLISSVRFVDECATGIRRLLDDECTRWTSMWSVYTSYVYNFTIYCESKHPETSVYLYRKLLSDFLTFEGFESVGFDGLPKPNAMNLRWPVSTLLHRITSVHSKHGNYKEASIVCCLNGLISSRRPIARNDENYDRATGKPTKSEDHKAFATWAFLQHKHQELRGSTMLKCFRSNADAVRCIIDVRSEDYDPIRLCFFQIKSLAVTPIDLSSTITNVIREMERLSVPSLIYGQAIQFLGYHALKESNSESSIAEFLTIAEKRYKRETNPSTSFRLCHGHLKFYEFRQRLMDIGLKTASEIKSVDSIVTPTTDSTDGQTEKIVPTYSTINMTMTMEIASSLERALTAWKTVTSREGYDDELEQWEIAQTLEIATVAGEYARFYHLENLEIEARKLAYELSRRSNDHRAIVYTTMRSLSSQRIDESWISRANESLKIIEKSNDAECKRIVEAYKIGLAEYYHQCGSSKLADEIFTPTAKWMYDIVGLHDIHLLSGINLRLNYCSNVDEDDDHVNYTRIVVQGLYSMIGVNDFCRTPTGTNAQRDKFYGYDVLFDFTLDLAPRMNSLIGYREISAHITSRLEVAQKLGASLRVAECLKALCYIDLTRARLDDCEVKVQAIEHILEIEGFRTTMAAKFPPVSSCERNFFATSSSNYVGEIVRDVRQNDSSPILRTKVFADPDFVIHNDTCTCFKCTNTRYQGLVFSATHIRAQLFALRRNDAAASQHFEGALTIKRNILTRSRKLDESSNARRKYRLLDVVEFVTLHLDYCRFIKWSEPRRTSDIVEIALLARSLCDDYGLRNHPIYVMTQHLIFESQYEQLYTDVEFSKFTVPAVEDIDISRYVNEPTNAPNPIDCATPIRPTVPQKSHSVRRKKNQPFLKLEKVPIDLMASESSPSTTPIAETRRIARRRVTKTERESVSISEVSDEREESADSTANVAIVVDEKIVEISKESDKNREKVDIAICVETIDATTKISSKTCGKSRKTMKKQSIVDPCEIPSTMEIDDVTKSLEEMTVTGGRSRISSTSGREPAENKRNTANLAILPDGAAVSGNAEILAETRRASARLRSRNKSATSLDNGINGQSSDTSAANSDDEVVIIETKPRKRTGAVRTRTASKRNT